MDGCPRRLDTGHVEAGVRLSEVVYAGRAARGHGGPVSVGRPALPREKR